MPKVNPNIFRSSLIKVWNFEQGFFFLKNTAQNIVLIEFIQFIFLNLKLSIIDYKFFKHKFWTNILLILAPYNFYNLKKNYSKEGINSKKTKYWQRFFKLFLEKLIYRVFNIFVCLNIKNVQVVFQKIVPNKKVLGNYIYKTRKKWKQLIDSLNFCSRSGSTTFFIEVFSKYFQNIQKKKNQVRNFYFFVKLLKSFLKIQTYILGFRIKVSGKLNGSMRKRKVIWNYGLLPLQTLNAKFKYSFKDIHTSYGCFGIKVWLFFR